MARLEVQRQAGGGGSNTTAVPYATTSDIVCPISDESKRIMTTAFAPINRAFSIIRSIAWRRVSEGSETRHDVANEATTADHHAEHLPDNARDSISLGAFGRRDEHRTPFRLSKENRYTVQVRTASRNDTSGSRVGTNSCAM
jgi:hypothetical protein